MENDVYEYVRICSYGIKNGGMQKLQNKNLGLFPPTRYLHFVVMDIIGPLSRTKWRKKFGLVMTGSYKKAYLT